MAQFGGDSFAEVPSDEAIKFFGESFNKIYEFAHLLEYQGEILGLIGPRELPRLWSRHIVNSAAVVRFLPQQGTVADVGSGAGFPGIVAACMLPDVKFTLIESMERRCDWLKYVCREISLRNVRVSNVRAEQCGERFDAVTARAVANLSKLIPWCMPLVKPGGQLVALKGEKAADEIEQARPILKKNKVSAIGLETVKVLSEPTNVVICDKA